MPFRGVDNIKNGRTRACAQVEDGNAGAGAVFGACAFDGTKADGLARANLTAHEIESLHMTACQVDNVDVVAYAGAIGGGVVVTEHLDAFQFPTATWAT